MAKNYGMAPAEGPSAGVPAKLDAAREALERAETPAEAQRVEAAAKALRELAATQDPEQAQDVTIEAADLTMRAARRVGELLPAPTPGRRGPRTSVCEVDRGAARRYRAIAKIAPESFDACLAGHRARRVPVTQSAVLKLVVKEPKEGGGKRRQAPKVRGAKLLERTATKLRELAQGDDAEAIEAAAAALDAAVARLRGEQEPEAGEPYGAPSDAGEAY